MDTDRAAIQSGCEFVCSKTIRIINAVGCFRSDEVVVRVGKILTSKTQLPNSETKMKSRTKVFHSFVYFGKNVRCK